MEPLLFLYKEDFGIKYPTSVNMNKDTNWPN